MSQTMESSHALDLGRQPAGVEVQPYAYAPREEFTYRPMPVMAPVSVVLGVCSAVALLGLLAVPFALGSLILSGLCLLKIVRSNGEYSGKALALTGVSLSALFLVSGSVLHAYTYATEVPEGYERINFTSDISKKGLPIVEGRPDVHPDVKALDGTKVFVKGYMYPTQETKNIRSFILVKDSGDCCFGGNPAITDMIMVEMEPGKTVDFYQGMVSVAGVFHAKAPAQAGTLSTVYKLVGTHFDRSRTSF